MSNDECGHTKADGDPCTFSEKYADGKCGHHTNEKEYEGGRPTKLSYERQEKIATAIESGKSISIASRKNDVSPRTVANWAEKGEADLENGKENEFTEFFQRFRRALGHKENWYWEIIMDMARENGDHRFIMSMLKSEFPDQWGETETGVEAAEISVESDVVTIKDGNDTTEHKL